MTSKTYKYVSGDGNYEDFEGEGVIGIHDETDFGNVIINEDFVSNIFLSRLVNIKVSENILDEFLCFTFKSKICLTEKVTKNKTHKINLIQKKYWPEIELYEYTGDYTGRRYTRKGFYFIFRKIKYNRVNMNNGNSFVVLL